jgi:EAL domain-containing protein (putative c-di-GMP-specific phosphodiesterase class I)
MIIAMGFYVLRKACEFLKQLHQKGYSELTMAVNVSHIQLREPDFIEKLTNILEDTQVDRHALELEITESIASDDIDTTIRKLNEIRRLGVQISIDDFGTGFSSLSVLRHLPASSLKIDKEFIDEIIADEHIARMVINLGHNLGMTAIAEGVERQEQLARLKELGCDTVQGWLYSPAITEDQVKEWLQSGR